MSRGTDVSTCPGVVTYTAADWVARTRLCWADYSESSGLPCVVSGSSANLCVWELANPTDASACVTRGEVAALNTAWAWKSASSCLEICSITSGGNTNSSARNGACLSNAQCFGSRPAFQIAVSRRWVTSWCIISMRNFDESAIPVPIWRVEWTGPPRCALLAQSRALP